MSSELPPVAVRRQTIRIARISDGIGTQHLRSGVLIIDLADEERSMLVRPDEILALIEDLEHFLETQGAPTTVAAA